MLVLRQGSGGKQQQVHSFLAGLLGGYYVFGQGPNAKSSVTQQIVIYIFARVALGLASLAVQPPGNNTLVGGTYGPHGGVGLLNLSPENNELLKKYSWPAFASLSWAAVMWLFETYPETLQPSLRQSMVYMCVFLSIVEGGMYVLTRMTQLPKCREMGLAAEFPLAQPVIAAGRKGEGEREGRNCIAPAFVFPSREAPQMGLCCMEHLMHFCRAKKGRSEVARLRGCEAAAQ